MEFDAADPVKVSFSAHDQIAVGHGPQLPGRVVTTSGHDVLLGVIRETGHAHQVALECALAAHVSVRRFKHLVERRVEPFPLGNGRRLICHLDRGLVLAVALSGALVSLRVQGVLALLLGDLLQGEIK